MQYYFAVCVIRGKRHHLAEMHRSSGDTLCSPTPDAMSFGFPWGSPSALFSPLDCTLDYEMSSTPGVRAEDTTTAAAARRADTGTAFDAAQRDANMNHVVRPQTACDSGFVELIPARVGANFATTSGMATQAANRKCVCIGLHWLLAG